MKSFAIRDLRTRPRAVQEALKTVSEAMLTSHGRPVALLLPVTADSVDESLALLRQARSLQTLRQLRREARLRHPQGLSDEAIDSLIRRVRDER